MTRCALNTTSHDAQNEFRTTTRNDQAFECYATHVVDAVHAGAPAAIRHAMVTRGLATTTSSNFTIGKQSSMNSITSGDDGGMVGWVLVLLTGGRLDIRDEVERQLVLRSNCCVDVHHLDSPQGKAQSLQDERQQNSRKRRCLMSLHRPLRAVGALRGEPERALAGPTRVDLRRRQNQKHSGMGVGINHGGYQKVAFGGLRASMHEMHRHGTSAMESIRGVATAAAAAPSWSRMPGHCVDDGSQLHVSAQRGSDKHESSSSSMPHQKGAVGLGSSDELALGLPAAKRPWKARGVNASDRQRI